MCDFIVLPSIDETQSGTLARIIALNKPFLTTAPMEGLTAQALESDEGLRHQLGDNLRRYLDTVVSWDVVTGRYAEAYALAREAVHSGKPVELPAEF